MRYEELSHFQKLDVLKRLHNRLNRKLFSGSLSPVRVDIQNAGDNYYSGEPIGAFFRRPREWDNNMLIAIDVWYDMDFLPQCKTQREQVLKLTELVLHEMIHQYCFENGIIDGENLYHNGAYMKAAREHGYSYVTWIDDYGIEQVDTDELSDIAIAAVESFRIK